MEKIKISFFRSCWKFEDDYVSTSLRIITCDDMFKLHDKYEYNKYEPFIHAVNSYYIAEYNYNKINLFDGNLYE